MVSNETGWSYRAVLVVVLVVVLVAVLVVVLVVVLSVQNPYKSWPQFPKSNKTNGFTHLPSQRCFKQTFGAFGGS